MLSRTHIAVGMAAALVACQPHDPVACALAIAGGAVGGDICDIDVRGRRDALVGRLLTVCIVCGLVAWDMVAGAHVIRDGVGMLGPKTALGVVIVWVTLMAGGMSEHRTLMHSLAAGAASTFGLWLVFPLLALPYAAGFASHVLLDLLNHRGVQVLWPLRKRVSLGLCHADGLVNEVLGVCGVVAVAALLWRALG